MERFYASGKISGSRFVKREGKPSEDAILASRVIDRTLRPLFDKNIRHAVQVITTVISLDDNDSVILAINAASLALLVSNIPWAGPIGAVRIGKYNGENSEKGFRINASPKFREEGSQYEFDLTVCGKGGKINMIEASAREAKEEDLEDALEKASAEIAKLENFQKKIAAEIGKEKRVIEKEKIDEESVKLFKNNILPEMKGAIFSGPGKREIDELHSTWNKMVKEKYPEREDFAPEDHLFDDTENEILHQSAVKENKRADGRAMDEVRDLYAKAGGLSSILHGSGIFYRGGTHVLSVLTLGGPEDRHMIDGMTEKTEKRFMHHYNLPPYSGGETGRAGFTNRREVGHGALAEKALLMVLPPVEEFPYTIRVVSESMASNGSTSQASICASSLALMDGGVPIKAPVAGIAMGLMIEQNPKLETRNPKYKILTDIQGPEYHHGVMDFKVAGTREGITAIQLDVKVDGVPLSILSEALAQAKTARMHILDVIEKEIASPRPAISPRAPEILTMRIRKDQIGSVIGPGGKVINGNREETGVDDITIEEDGTIFITGRNGSGAKAFAAIEEITHEYKPGERFEGEVTRLMEFGAFVRIGKNTEGLVHVSEIAPFRINKVADVLKEGERVHVIIKEIDEKGRVNLSIKQVDPEFAKRKGIEPSSR